MAREKKLPPPTPSEAAFERLLADFPTGTKSGHDRGAPFDKLRVTIAPAATQISRHPEPVEGCATIVDSDAGAAPIDDDARVFLDELYAHAREYLERDPY